MRRIFSLLLTLASTSALVAVMSACSEDAVNDACDPNCTGCCATYDATTNPNPPKCTFSINCAPGAICNLATEDLYDTGKPADVCIKVVCAGDSECTAPKTCSLERICEAPVCQTDDECSGSNLCLGGACQPAPNASDVASCTVVTPSGAIRQGATMTLTAVAKNGNGAILPSIRYVWASSAPDSVSIADDVATGGATSGPATVTAKVLGKESVTCDRNVTLNNFANLTAGQARVVLVADDDGSPVDGATVTVIGGGDPAPQTTGADGSALFASINGAVTSITVVKQGWQYVSVLSPPADTFIPLPRIADKTRAGGFRGSIDISAATKGDVKIGIAGPSLPTNLLDFDFTSLIGDFIDTTIDAPELGLNNEMVSLPGGVVFALGSKKFTDDSGTTNMRCQGKGPTDTELGCYVARAPKGPAAAWALAGRLTLASVSKVAGALSSAFGGSGGEVNIGDILTKVLPLFRTLNHAANPGLVITEFAKVNVPGKTGNCADPNLANYDDNCIGDFSKYQPITLAADQTLAIDSAVAIPTLPAKPTGGFAGQVVVISAAITEGRGIIPLGLTAGVDVLDTETADGKIAGVEKPFGERSEKLADGKVPLTMSPPHGGLEGSKVALIAISLDADSLSGGGSGTQFSGLVRFVDRVGAEANFGSAAFLTFPAGTFDIASAAFTPQGTVAGATVMRLELGNGDKTWLIYAPAGSAIAVPNVAAARTEILGAGTDAFIQAVRGDATYADVFTFGSGKNLNRALELIQAFAVQECKTVADAPDSPCKIQ
ncbi:MAG: hypothetical protein IT384_24305 [Deltaproteobacteria bacterium]|nr:hypothetical protein [Deltaproteobacteria bacterium]